MLRKKLLGLSLIFLIPIVTLLVLALLFPVLWESIKITVVYLALFGLIANLYLLGSYLISWRRKSKNQSTKCRVKRRRPFESI